MYDPNRFIPTAYEFTDISGLVKGAIISGTVGVYAATTILSQSVYYNNSTSGASSTNVKGALDGLYIKDKTKECKKGYSNVDTTITGGYVCEPSV